MKVKDFIKALERCNPEGTVWISDEQGGGGEANQPHQLTKEYEFDSGETADVGDAMTSYENT